MLDKRRPPHAGMISRFNLSVRARTILRLGVTVDEPRDDLLDRVVFRTRRALCGLLVGRRVTPLGFPPIAARASCLARFRSMAGRGRASACGIGHRAGIGKPNSACRSAEHEIKDCHAPVRDFHPFRTRLDFFEGYCGNLFWHAEHSIVRRLEAAPRASAWWPRFMLPRRNRGKQLRCLRLSWSGHRRLTIRANTRRNQRVLNDIKQDIGRQKAGRPCPRRQEIFWKAGLLCL
jgi:hypothetical protein